MTKRVLSVLSGAALFLSAVSCGDEKEDGGSSKASSKSAASGAEGEKPGKTPFSSVSAKELEGDYANFSGIRSVANIYDESVDDGLRSAISEYADLGLASLSFDDGKFEALGNYVNKEFRKFYGSYSVEDGRIVFDYEKCHTEQFDLSVDEFVPEPDNDVILGRSEKLKGLSNEERNALIKQEQNNKARTSMQETLRKLSEQESYLNHVGPKSETSDRATAENVTPRFIRNIIGTTKAKDVPVHLYAVDDLICVPTYGFEIEGSYKTGKDFKVSFDPYAPLYDDEYSVILRPGVDRNEQRDGETREERYRNRIASQIGGDGKTTIEFSGGKWTWRNSEGELVNNGYYLESSEHEGLVAMFIDESSKNYDKIYASLRPLFFYVDGENEVWYPNWVKMD